MSDPIESTLDQYSFTPEQHSAYSQVIKEMKKHQFVIYKCKQTAKESPSYVMMRAIAGVEYHKKVLSNHDKELEERIEKTVRKLREDADDARKKKESYLADAEKKLADLESVKSRAQVSAELELENLRKKLEKMNLPRIVPVPSSPLPKTHTRKKICPCGKGCEDIDKCLMTFKSPAELAMEKRVKKELEEEAEEDKEEEAQAQPPPLTPFGGLPPPDPPRQEKKPVKTIPPGRILYAAPIEVS
jgi:hypothetical protein